jgi:hypothetical protein
MMLLEECRVSKGPGADGIPSQLVAHIGCTEAVSYTNELCALAPMALLDGVDPHWDGFVCECGVFSLPRVVVELWIRTIMPILAVFPNGIL